MRATITDKSSLSAISPMALHSYLSAQGWVKVEPYGEKGDWYRYGDGTEIIVPAKEEFVDYYNSVSQIIEAVAHVEARSELSVYRDISVAETDLIRIRAPEAEDDGSIGIEAGVLFYQQSRELLLAAACSASKPQRAYRAGKIKEAADYLSQVRMGQTERGSFILTFLSPVPPSLTKGEQTELWPSIVEDPFNRRVTRTLMNALVAVKEAVMLVNRGEMIDAFESRVEEGISANLCDAAAKLISHGSGLDVELTWAATRPAPKKRAIVAFSKSDAATLEEAAKVLREREPRPDEQIFGFVTALSRDQQATEGRVTVKAQIDDKLSSVKVDFGPDLYSQAVAAHEDRRPISLTGDLQREGQRWKLNNPREFTVLPRDADEDDPK